MEERLSKLITSEVFSVILQSGGMIAGGAMVYVVNNDLTEQHTNDVDVWFTSKQLEEANELLQTLSNMKDVQYFGACQNTFVFKTKNKYIQVMYTNLPSHEHILNFFDLDYCKIGYTKHGLLILDEASKAKQNRTLYRVRGKLSLYRLVKAYRKGYRLPEGSVVSASIHYHDTDKPKIYTHQDLVKFSQPIDHTLLNMTKKCKMEEAKFVKHDTPYEQAYHIDDGYEQDAYHSNESKYTYF